jgi:hypothetical protein
MNPVPKPGRSFQFLIAGIIALPTSLLSAVEFDQQIPQLVFSAAELADAMQETSRSDLQISLVIEGDDSSPEELTIQRDGGSAIRITGTDANGAMYGGAKWQNS